MKNKRRIIGIVAATMLAVIGTVSLVGYVQSAKDEAVAQEALVDVYVVETFVPKGAEPETIRSSVTIEQVPARLKQADAITELEAVGDQVAASDLQPGDQLVAARLAAKDVVSAEIADKVQVSALLEAERAVGGALQKGDLVGVYISFDPFDLDVAGQNADTDADADTASDEAIVGFADGTGGQSAGDESTADGTADESTSDGPDKTPNVSRLEFRNVLVTNVQTITAPVSPDENDETDDGGAQIAQVTGTQFVVTLALSPEQSERFVFATEFGRIRLSLDPATVADDGTRPVTLGNVFTVVK
jgi:Flp pilus assembly protein RcpC/CpaB